MIYSSVHKVLKFINTQIRIQRFITYIYVHITYILYNIFTMCKNHPGTRNVATISNYRCCETKTLPTSNIYQNIIMKIWWHEKAPWGRTAGALRGEHSRLFAKPTYLLATLMHYSKISMRYEILCTALWYQTIVYARVFA